MNIPDDLRYSAEHEWVRVDANLATVGITDFAEHTDEDLGAALESLTKKGMKRLVLDLRGLSFFDSTGLHLLVALHQRAQRDGFQLTLVAPAAPADHAIKLSGLDQVLPFVAADDAVDREPGDSTGSHHGGIR